MTYGPKVERKRRTTDKSRKETKWNMKQGDCIGCQEEMEGIRPGQKGADCARQHLMAAGRVIEAQRKIQRGSSTQKRNIVCRLFAKSVRRTKQQRQRRQAVNRWIWAGAARDYTKARGSGRLLLRSRQHSQGEANERHMVDNLAVKTALTQPWVAVGSSTTDRAPKIGRTEDDGILFKIKIQIQGKAYVALIDSGVSRCYASPELCCMGTARHP